MLSLESEIPDSKLLDVVGHPSIYLHTLQVGNVVLVYHSLLGNLRYADPNILRFFALSKHSPSLDQLECCFPNVDLKEQVGELHRLGLLVVGDTDHQLRLRIQQCRGSHHRGELVHALRLNASTLCNQNCEYCYANNATQGLIYMPLDTALKSVRLYTDLLLEHRRNLMQIRYFGGEPLLNWHVVLDSMDYAAELASQHNMTLRFYLNTNATLLNQFITHRLSVHRNSLYIIVSLDGSAAVHNAARKFLNGRGSFDLVCRGLDLIQQENIPVTTSATLGTHNREHLRGLIDLLLARNIYSLSISPICVVPENSHPQTLADALIDAIEYARPYKLQIIGFWRDIFQRLEHGTTSYTFCGGSGSELSIQPNGDVYPCHLQPFRLGTLDDIGTRALFATETYHQVAMRTVGNLPECEGCEIEGLCAGGCAADACAYEHNLHGRTRHCDFFRTMVRHHLIYLGWLAQQDIIHT